MLVLHREPPVRRGAQQQAARSLVDPGGTLARQPGRPAGPRRATDGELDPGGTGDDERSVDDQLLVVQCHLIHRALGGEYDLAAAVALRVVPEEPFTGPERREQPLADQRKLYAPLRGPVGAVLNDPVPWLYWPNNSAWRISWALDFG